MVFHPAGPPPQRPWLQFPGHLLQPENQIILLEEAGRVPKLSQVKFDRYASDVRLKIDLR